MRIYFVIDLMDGLVVRALRGERESYRPIEEFSEVVSSSDPVDVVKEVEPKYLYVADLDRILGKGDNLEVIRKLRDEVDHIIADCGFRSADDLKNVDFTPVLGTETFDLLELEKVEVPAFVSLDMKGERLISVRKFELKEALEFLNSFDLPGVIALSMDRVGTKSLDFETIEKVVSESENPVFVGGGISSTEDLVKLKDMGCEGALISTSIHTKSIDVEVVRRGFF